MEDYSKEDIIKSFLSLDNKTRKREIVDQRSYLIGMLAYRFMMTEFAIAKACSIKRDTVNYNKKLAVQFYNDKAYAQNVYVYAQLYPFDFSIIETSKTQRQKTIELVVDQKFYNKLKTAGAILGHDDIRTTVKLFLVKSLKLWDE